MLVASPFLVGMFDGVEDDVSDMLICVGVDHLSTPSLHGEQASVAKHPEMLGDQGLARPSGFH